MKRAILEEKLNYTKAYRKTRLEVANWVLNNPDTFSDLLDFCYDLKNDISYKASWILEFVVKDDLSLVYPEIDRYCNQLEHITRDQSLRPMAKICEMLTTEYYIKQSPAIKKVLTQKHKEQITANCFDWLITDQKVACKAYSISALYLLGTEFDWIHPELETILREGYNKHTAAFKARARHFLTKIEKRKKQKPHR
ncbi:MAG: adenylosuccinate lyase [Gilvibacter sp.]